MSRYIRLLTAVAAVLAVASIADAQSRVPDTRMFAVGGNVGVGAADGEVRSSVPLGAHVDYYVTPRVSVRPSVFFSSPQIGNETDTAMGNTRIGVDGIYNWERGKWHPFVGAGLGVHRLNVEENDVDLAEGTKLGPNLLAGLEYFANRDAVIKGEVGYQPVDSLSGWPAPTSLVGTVGVKWYF